METVAPKTKLTDAKDDSIVGNYVKIRDRRALRKAAFDAEDADDKAKQERMEAEMLRRFNERGAESIRTTHGTAYKSTRTSATVADKDTYITWILQDPVERVNFLDVRANKTTVQQYKGEHNDLPPGLNWREELTVGFRRS